MQNADAFKVAAVRAGLQALIVGGAAAIAVWATTDEVKSIVIAGATPALGILAARLGIEGTYDATKAAPAGGESSISTEPPLG